MIRPWEKFTAVEHQIGIEYIAVVRRSRGVLVAEIGTVQKYPELMCYSGTELVLSASRFTPERQYDPDAPATAVVFPRALRSWDVVTPDRGRYSLTIALYKPARRFQTRFTRQNEDWRTALLTKEES
jgi:hypothetical protein